MPGSLAAVMRGLLPAALVVAGCGPPAGVPTPRRVLLVTLDTTRADRIGAYGYTRARTPTLDGLARDGVLFEQAFAAAPVTLPSHTSILTGVYPAAHGVRDNGIFALSDEATLISEVLHERGWRTGAFTGAYVLDPKFGLAQGFEEYPAVRRGRDPHDSRPADEVVSDAIEWLRGIEPQERFFVWVHFFDPHSPYAAHKPGENTIDQAYDAEIAFCDQQLDRLLRFMEGAGLADDLLIAVTADHGESLGTQGENTHGSFIYQATIHIPLILAGRPLTRNAGTRVGRPVSHVQLAPTLLELLGIPRTTMPASRLAPLLEPDGAPASAGESDLLLETLAPYYSYGWKALQGLVSGRYKLIRGRATELYALDDDPEETRDLAPTRADEVRRLEARLDALLTRTIALGWTDGVGVDATDAELLARLGYVSKSRDGDPFDPTLPDPRERIIDLTLYQQAQTFLLQYDHLRALPAPPTAWKRAERERARRGILDATRALLLLALEGSPRNVHVWRSLGRVERELGDLERSIAWLERSVAAEPRLAETQYELALSYWAAGRRKDAFRQAVEALRLSPRHPVVYKALVAWSIEAEDFGRAHGWLEAWARITKPASPEAARLEADLVEVDAEMRARGQRPIAPPELAAGEDG